MIGTIIGHYKIESKLGEGGMSKISPRTIFVSGWKFQDPRLPCLAMNGGQAPSFWRRRVQ